MKSLVTVVSLAVVVLLVSACGGDGGEPSTAEPAATAPPVSGKIAFTSIRDANADLYVMNADGSGLTSLTDSPAFDAFPAWSPDGSRIVFDSDRDGNVEIYIINSDGSDLTRLTNNAAEDTISAWSPDGSCIAFVSGRDGNPEIYVMNPDGSVQTRLTNDPADDIEPAWSPDASRIAFYSSRDGNFEIYVMNADGSDQTRLTDHVADDAFPAWSPDGSRIVFRSTRDGNPEIYGMNSDGSGLVRLTDDPGVDNDPSWSPDGSRIAFASDRDGNPEIYVMNADGSGLTRLTDDPAIDIAPAWSPTFVAGEQSGEETSPGRCEDLTGIVPADTRKPIQIAVVVALSGLSSPDLGQGAVNAVQMAIEDHGPIRGFTVQQNNFDGKCGDPTAGEAAGNDVVANSDNLGVIGHMCSPSYRGGLPVYETAGVVTISGSATGPGLPPLGPTVFNRTMIADPEFEEWAGIVETLPTVIAWQADYQVRFPGELPFALLPFYYDATSLLLTRISEVASVHSGNLVIDRDELADAVRDTEDFLGVTCLITLDELGSRISDLDQLTPCSD